MGCTIFGFLLDCYLASILIGSQLWSSSVCEQFLGYKIDTSPSVTVQRGLCVHVPCSFTVPGDVRLSISTTGHLYNGNGDPVTSKNNSVLKTNGHFFLTGNVSNGDCSYSIEDPLPMHEGIYYFRFEDEDSKKFSYRDIQPYVNVTDLTDKPTISSTRLVEGNEVNLTCTSPGRCLKIRPQITWDWERTMTGIRQEMYNITYEDDSRTFQSNITFTPRKSHNNSTLFCNVTFEGNFSTAEKKTLNVEYPPSMNITLEGADTDDVTAVNVTDGDSITMKCIVDSNPEASITWYKEDIEVQPTISDRTVTLTLSNITLSDAGRYRCSAENEHGAAHRTVEIIYHSPEVQGALAQGYIVAAAVGGVVLLLLIIAIGALLIMFFRKKKHQNMNENLKDMSMKDADAMYCNPECIMHNVVSPEDAAQKDLKSSQGGDLVYMNYGDVQYASVQFSKVKPKVVASEDSTTEYSEIKKTQNNY
ncbi:sialic acid-binding Ig-like lectin 12 isoform X2 [Bufo bufo]|uniref:sialic acid-binding Ig-like lectin 12 isoform X2 n=1 Tax=Bufo bufo TaxID=8384 RepID=UPI001ABE63F2|nr:sialic acid-binding Ig-like lectin 12 isoform X2 [Bufo bufo]